MIVDLLGKLADAELLRLHQFEPDQPTLRQPLGCQLQTRVMDHRLRHQNAATAIAEAVGDVLLCERSHDLPTVLFVMNREQQSVGRLPGPHPAAGQNRQKQRDPYQSGQFLTGVKADKCLKR